MSMFSGSSTPSRYPSGGGPPPSMNPSVLQRDSSMNMGPMRAQSSGNMSQTPMSQQGGGGGIGGGDSFVGSMRGGGGPGNQMMGGGGSSMNPQQQPQFNQSMNPQNSMMMNPQQSGQWQQQQQQQGGWNPQQQQQGGHMMGGPQQQQGGYNPQWGQQGQGMWGQPGPSMFDCCNQQQGMPMQQQGMCAACCPVNPNEHFIETHPDKMSACQGMWQTCDATTWVVTIFFFLSVIGFAIALGTKDIDALMDKYGVANSAQLDIAMFNDLKAVPLYVGTVLPTVRCNQLCALRNGTNVITTVNTSVPVPPGATPDLAFQQPTSNQCGFVHASADYTGLFGGKICDDHQLSATAMLINLSRWNNFRGTLYFIAFMGTMILLSLIVLVNKHQVSVHFGPNSLANPPFKFFGTPFYYMFRFAWGVVSVVIFLWVCTEMYQYWFFESIYLTATTGKLQDFWRAYDKKFVGTVVCVTIYLCWPLIQLVLQFGLFFGLMLPWMCIKNMLYPQLLNYQKDNVHEDEESFCVSADMFFSQYRQLQRLGFSQGMWELMTETQQPYTTCDPMGQTWQQQQMSVSQQHGDQHPPGGFEDGGLPGGPAAAAAQGGVRPGGVSIPMNTASGGSTAPSPSRAGGAAGAGDDIPGIGGGGMGSVRGSMSGGLGGSMHQRTASGNLGGTTSSADGALGRSGSRAAWSEAGDGFQSERSVEFGGRASSTGAGKEDKKAKKEKTKKEKHDKHEKDKSKKDKRSKREKSSGDQ